MNKSFIIIEISKKKILIKRIIFSRIILLIIIGAILYNTIEERFFSKIYFSFFIIWIFTNIYSNFFINSFNIKGNIIFSDKKIVLPKLDVIFNQIKLIKINVNSYKGEPHKGMYIGIGTAAPQEGTNNSIVIELKNNKKLKYNFLINYKKEFELIKRILLYYKKNGVNVSYILKGKVII